MSEPDLFELFPEMTPVKRPPSMFTLNGVGLSMYGKRDLDPETGTYVKTHCAVILFIPVLGIGSYRVADSDNGWYFVGKVALSPMVRAWNSLVMVIIACMVLAGCAEGTAVVG